MPFRPSLRPRSGALSSRLTRAILTAIVAVSVPAAADGQSPLQAPDSLTDAEFWSFFKTMSEKDGYFLSENFVSKDRKSVV